MAPTTARQSFRAVLAQVAEQARAVLPESVNGRIESAVKLVLGQDVAPQADGSVLVGSSADPLKTYRLVGTSCECQDFTRGQAPGGWCQHKIAAGIHKRVGQLLAAQPEPAPVVPVEEPVPMDTELLEPFPANDDEPQPEAPARLSATSASTLPEAPASVNCHITVAGRQVQLTLRDHDEARLLVRLEELLQRYPLPQPVKDSR